ncbi:MAG: carboxypeptidase-like regulatory domain-containing protein [Kiritimatiellaeota bacterium]|nr:carboxypeptidase-like regulatory domain-containing protein [Kiritimatiellota bacterium]
MKRVALYGSILALVLLAVWLFKGSRDVMEGERPREPKGWAMESPPVVTGEDDLSQYRDPYNTGGVVPTGTPPLFLTWEQQLNPVRGPARNDTPEERMGKHRGAKAKFKILAVDSERTPVPGVNVEARFITRYDIPVDVQKKESDENGFCAFEGLSTSVVTLKASKEGYYTTEHEHYLFVHNAPWNCVKNGRWQPWDATLELVLKEKRNPAALYVKHLEIHLPQKGASYGFDCTVGDLVEPDGKGKAADLIFTYNAEERTAQGFNRELRIETVNGGGFIRGTRDMWSELKGPYIALESGYVPEIVLRARSIPDVISEDSCLKKSEYLVFETYSRGEQPCVGKICGALFTNKSFKHPEGGSTSYFLYFFNPVPGDRRIESDPDKNLFGRASLLIECQP